MDLRGAKSLNADNCSITFLGTEAASLSPQSATSAYWVDIQKCGILVDAGIGVLGQVRKAGYNPEDIDLILITHWHIDHFAGLPQLLKARTRDNPQIIYGPTMPLSARIYLRLFFGSLGTTLEVVSGDFSRIYGQVRIQAIPNLHGVGSYGWAISEEPGGGKAKTRKIVISGDTRPAESVFNLARGTDLLVHEATYLDRDAGTAIRHHHSTAREAAELAFQAGAGALALTHIPRRYSRQEIRREAQKFFPRVIVPAPLDTIHIGGSPDSEIGKASGWAQITLAARGCQSPGR